jgi:hypothetical protein
MASALRKMALVLDIRKGMASDDLPATCLQFSRRS